MLTRDHADLPATHTSIHKWNEPQLSLLPQRQSVTALWLVLISVPLRVEGWVGLNGWLQTEVA